MVEVGARGGGRGGAGEEERGREVENGREGGAGEGERGREVENGREGGAGEEEIRFGLCSES